MRYHVVVIGSRPDKVDGKYVPLPEENVSFIQAVLGRLPATDYAFIYHGDNAGVDQVADDYAFANRIRVKHFPAYWFNPRVGKAPNFRDASAGFFSTERMLTAAKDAIYNKSDEQMVLLAFHNKPIAQSPEVDHALKYASKFAGLGTTIHLKPQALPVQSNTLVTNGNPAVSSNPF